MRLKEWLDANGKKVSTTSGTSSSATSSGSFRKRLDKLITYYGQHLPKEIDYINVGLLTADTLNFVEHYDTGSKVEFKIYIGPATEAWSFKVWTDGKLTDDLSGMGWPELLKTLRAYITVPVTGMPEYKGLLTEWVDAKGNKVSHSTSTQTPISSTAGGYKKRFEKLIKYHIDHASSELERITYKDIKDYSFHLSEHYNTGSQEFDREIVVRVDKATDTFYLNIFVNGKVVYRNDYEGYEKVLEILTDTYMFLPNEGTSDYDDLLAESLKESSEAVPNKLYHATYKQFLKSIQQKGLGNMKRKMWSDSKTGVVYLADDPWVAESYAETAEWPEDRDDPDAYYDNIIILEIDTTKLDTSKLKVDENVLLDEGEENSTWEYHGIIPWDAIKIFDSSIAEDFKLYENLWD